MMVVMHEIRARRMTKIKRKYHKIRKRSGNKWTDTFARSE